MLGWDLRSHFILLTLGSILYILWRPTEIVYQLSHLYGRLLVKTAPCRTISFNELFIKWSIFVKNITQYLTMQMAAYPILVKGVSVLFIY